MMQSMNEGKGPERSRSVVAMTWMSEALEVARKRLGESLQKQWNMKPGWLGVKKKKE